MRRVGWWAPGLLIALRVVQGFSTGGEYGGAATFMAESSPDDKRGTYGSFLEFGAVGGFVMGSAVVLAVGGLLSHEQMMALGWRIPFLLALPLGVVGLVLRSRMPETPVFSECVACDAITGSAWDRLVDLLTNYARPIAVTFALLVALNIIDYTLVTYQPTYLHATAGPRRTQQDSGGVGRRVGDDGRHPVRRGLVGPHRPQTAVARLAARVSLCWRCRCTR